jgi:hypothetical protein
MMSSKTNCTAYGNNIALTMLCVDMFKQYDENKMKRHEYEENGRHRRVGITEQGGIWGEEAKAYCFPT